MDIARGLAHLHERNVRHSDLKCSNVLLNSSAQDPRGFNCKISDFGMARKVGKGDQGNGVVDVGTVAYMAPEVLASQEQTKAADIYSVGIMSECLRPLHPLLPLDPAHCSTFTGCQEPI